MRFVRAAGLVALLLAGMLVLSCGDDDDDDGGAPSDGESPSATATATAADSTPAAGGDRGSATLTIGDQTWEFDAFSCAFGHEATQSDVYAFSSDARTQHTNGNQLQMQVDIRDESGEGRFEGEGVVYEIFLQDITDFENPAVDWNSSNSSFGGQSGETEVTIDGDHVTATGLFHEGDAFDAEQVSGTFDGTCGAQTRR